MVITSPPPRAPDKWTRRLRTASYALLAVAGIMFAISPVLRGTFGLLIVALGIFMAIGATVGTVGSISGLWVGEFVGLPLLLSSLLGFAILAMFINWQTAPYAAVGQSALLLSLVTGMAQRWREVKSVQSLAVFLAKRGPGE